jgi:hypothetical protein
MLTTKNSTKYTLCVSRYYSDAESILGYMEKFQWNPARERHSKAEPMSLSKAAIVTEQQ